MTETEGLTLDHADARRLVSFHEAVEAAMDTGWRVKVHAGHYVARADVAGVLVEITQTTVDRQAGVYFWAVSVDGTISVVTEDLESALAGCRERVAEWAQRALCALGAVPGASGVGDTGRAGLAAFRASRGRE
jgi:hypothetical protein